MLPVFERLVTHQLIGLLDLPGRDLRLILETGGKLKVIDATDLDPEVATTILDLSMYGEEIAAVRDMTLAPAFERNGSIYLVWGIKPVLKKGGTRVSRFALPISNPPMIDLESKLDLFFYPSGDHVGASLRFGPDGYLYIGTGDGSGPNPPDLYRTAQNLSDVRATEPIKANRNRRQFSYPAGTVFANTISQKVLDENNFDSIVRLETQVLVFDGFNRHPYTYRWNQLSVSGT